MKRLQNLSILIALAVLLGAVAEAQSGGSATKHYENDRLTFEYPAGWTLTEGKAPDTQTVTLARQGSTAQIIVSMQGRPTSACDFQAERTKIANALAEKVATQIQAGAAPVTAPITTQIGGTEVDGTQIHGVIDHNPALGDVYATRSNRRYISLVFVRVEGDELANSAWNTVRTSLKIEPARSGVTAAPNSLDAPISGGVLNGRALQLPKPGYPGAAREAHVAGTVVIQVLIDESGAVISAHAIAGDPLLQEVCVAAARKSVFSPTRLCGEPVRVTGIITYNFVAR